ncbi:MAG: hypothetical protein AAFR53_11950, partial [Pseudomonadota bacterium]
ESAAKIYASRAAFEAATIPNDVQATRFVGAGNILLDVIRAPAGYAHACITSNGGTVLWQPPTDEASPQHYAENLVEGATDMSAAILKVKRFMSYGDIPPHPATTSAMHAMVKNTTYRTIDGRGQILGVSSPQIFGGLDTNHDGTFDVPGSGMLHAVRVTNMKFKALPGFDNTPLATFDHPTEGVITAVPACVLFVGTYDQYDRKTTMGQKSLVSQVEFYNVEVDASFLTNGAFFQNTRKCALQHVYIANIQQNGYGFLTSVGNYLETPNVHGTVNPTGLGTQNTELRLIDVTVLIRDRRSQTPFPDGHNDESWNGTCFGWFTADGFMSRCIGTASRTSMIIDATTNMQLDQIHMWGGPVIIGKDCAHIAITNVYYDFGDWRFYSFNHNCAAHMLLAGVSNLVMVATEENETGAGFVMSGLIATNGSNIVFEEDKSLNANASWAPFTQRQHTFTAMAIDEATTPFREYIPNTRYLTFDYRTVFIGAVDFAGEVGGASVQSSPTDTGAGKLLKNGAHGLGELGDLELLTDFEAVLVPGYALFQEHTANAAPGDGEPYFCAAHIAKGGAYSASIHAARLTDNPETHKAWWGLRSGQEVSPGQPNPPFWHEIQLGVANVSDPDTVDEAYRFEPNGTFQVHAIVTIDVTNPAPQTFPFPTLPAGKALRGYMGTNQQNLPATMAHLTGTPNAALSHSNILALVADASVPGWTIHLEAAGAAAGGEADKLILSAWGAWE